MLHIRTYSGERRTITRKATKALRGRSAITLLVRGSPMSKAADATAGVFIALWLIVALLMVLACFGACGAFAAYIKYNSKKCVHERRETGRCRDQAESRAIRVAQKAAAFASNQAAGVQHGWSAVFLLDDAEERVEVRVSLAVHSIKAEFHSRLERRLEKAKQHKQANTRMAVGSTPSNRPTPKTKKAKTGRGLFGALRRKLDDAHAATKEEESASVVPALVDDVEAQSHGRRLSEQLSASHEEEAVGKWIDDDEGY